MAQFQITSVKDELGNSIPTVGGLLQVPYGTWHVYFRVWDLPADAQLETVLAACKPAGDLPSNPNVASGNASECSRDTVNYPSDPERWYATFINDNPEGQDVPRRFRLWPKYTKLDGNHQQDVTWLMFQA